MAFCFCLPASVSSSCSHICYFLRISCSMKIISFSLLNSYKQILTKHAQNFSIYKILIKLQARFFCQCYNCIIFMCNFCILLQLLFWISFFLDFPYFCIGIKKLSCKNTEYKNLVFVQDSFIHNSSISCVCKMYFSL